MWLSPEAHWCGCWRGRSDYHESHHSPHQIGTEKCFLPDHAQSFPSRYRRNRDKSRHIYRRYLRSAGWCFIFSSSHLSFSTPKQGKTHTRYGWSVVPHGLRPGELMNMDGTAIYFPIVVVFLAATQGSTLNAADYIIVILLLTLASIGNLHQYQAPV